MRWAPTRLRGPLATTLTAVLLTIGASGPAGPDPTSPPPAASTIGGRAPQPCTTTDITLPGPAGPDTYRLRLCLQARQQPHGRELRAALAIATAPHSRRATFVASGVLKVCPHPTTAATLDDCVTARSFQTGIAGSSGALRHSPWWAVGACPREDAYVAVLTTLVLHGRPSNLTLRPPGEPDLVSPPRAVCP